MEITLNELRTWVDAHSEALIESNREQIAIPSVEGSPAPGAPFGTAVAQALDHILSLGSRMGFHVENHEGYIGIIEWGEGEVLGVLSHVDVVPPGDLSAWDSKPSEMTARDGFLIGRGVADDKGPLLSCLYGMWALKELGFTPNKCVRIIIGTNEESGWGCMTYYKKHFQPPAYSFSPDGMYTVVNREKGILRLTLQKRLACGAVEIEAGEASNLVPAHAEARLAVPAAALRAAVNAWTAPEGMHFEVRETENGTEILCTGKNAPSHSPDKGVSAIDGLMHVLATVSDAPAELREVSSQILTLMGAAPDGAAMGIACSDDVSGSLTTNLGLLSLKDGLLTLTLDVRTPVTVDLDGICSKIVQRFEALGFEKTDVHPKYPLYVPADTEFIQTLCRVYEDVTGNEAVLSAIGGGTYARAFQNCVCFGAVYPGETLTVHSPNERTAKVNILLNTCMYGKAIYELTKQ